MRRLIPIFLATAVGVSTAQADPAKTGPFSDKSFGDGGGYKHPDAAVGEYFETKPGASGDAKPQRPQIPAKVAPEIKPIAAVPSRPRPRPFAPVAAKTDASSRSAIFRLEKAEQNASGPSTTEKRGGTPSSYGSVVSSGGDDAASENARRDYETRLLSAPPRPRRAGLADSNARPLIDPAPAALTSEGMLFISLELDPKEAGTLRDAVAGLGAAAAFREDARFQPLPGEGGLVRISGWLPVSRLGAAIARPGVKRVAVERGSLPAGDARITGGYFVRLRVGDPARPAESIAAGVRELAEVAGFKTEKVVGVEIAPGGGSAALVFGTMPVFKLSRALGLSDVVSISAELPADTASAGDSSAAAGRAPAKKEGFLNFVMERCLWLILLTALLALPAVGRGIKSGLAVFVPYR